MCKKLISNSRKPIMDANRECSLAYCELYLLLTALTLRVFPQMRLFETTERDIRYDHDMFVPLTHDDSKGVRVTIE
jgi:hypothetical protein